MVLILCGALHPKKSTALLTIENFFETEFWELCENFVRNFTDLDVGTVSFRHMGVQVSRKCTNFYGAKSFGGLLLDLAKKHTLTHNTPAPDLALLFATMALNDQAILAEWSKQRNNEDGDEWRWRLGNPPNNICEVYWPVAEAAVAATTARRR